MTQLRLISTTGQVRNPLQPSRLGAWALLAALGLGGLTACADYKADDVAPQPVSSSAEQVEAGFSPTPRNRPVLPASAPPATATFIDPTATIAGAELVSIGQRVYIGPFARLLANGEPGQGHYGLPVVPASQGGYHDHGPVRIRIGRETNVQDNVTIYAGVERDGAARQQVAALGLPDGVEIGERVIMAHGTTVKGPVQIAVEGTNIPVDPDDDQEVFLSFGCEIDGAILEKNTGVSALARVGPGVRLRSGFIVLPGKNVTTQREADDPSLGKVRLLVEADIAFNEAVLEVNTAFAREYTRLYRDNVTNVLGISMDPGNTAFNPTRDLPTLAGRPTRLSGFPNRIIGDVRLKNTLPELWRHMGRDISLRADEGEPFIVGEVARMDDNVIFHALEGASIQTGDNVRYGQRVIVHGGGRRPLGGGSDNESTIIEDNVTLRDQAVVFRSLIGRGATIGRKSAVVNTDVAPGTVIPERVVYVNNALFGPVEW